MKNKWSLLDENSSHEVDYCKFSFGEAYRPLYSLKFSFTVALVDLEL